MTSRKEGDPDNSRLSTRFYTLSGNQVSSQLISENYRQRQYLTKFCRNDLLLISALYSLLFSSRSRDTFLRNQVVDNVKTELSRWFSFMLSNGDLK